MNPYARIAEYLYVVPNQQYRLARTARNHNPAVITALIKYGGGLPGTVNLDLGGGPFRGTNALLPSGGRSIIIDPYARKPHENEDAMITLRSLAPGGVDTVTLGNVLNVIPQQVTRHDVLWQAHDALKPGGRIFIVIHEGDRSGNGNMTRDGWQANLPTSDYASMIEGIFIGVCRIGNLVLAGREP